MKRQIAWSLVLLASAAWGLDGTLKWKGPATGGEWGDAANWEVSGTSSYSVEELLAKKTVWDFTKLADGAVVSNNTAVTILGGLVFSQTNAGTITLAGTKEFKFPNENIETTIGAGTTLEFQLGHASPWGNDTAGKKWVILGNGTLHLNPATSIDTYKMDLQPCHTSTVVLGPRYYSSKSFVTLYNNATARFESNVTLAALRIGHAGCTVDLNGHDCYICSGETSFSGGVHTFHGRLVGKGNLYYTGGESWSLGHEAAPALLSGYEGWLRFYDGSLSFPASFAFPETLHLAVNAGGTMTVNKTATVHQLAGEGLSGTVKVADGQTLAVTGPAGSNDVFKARLAGNADFVKDGAGYTLTLAGDNRHGGATTVAAGTLALKRPFVRRGRVRYWSFDDPENLGRDSGEYGCALDPKGETAPYSVPGVNGGRAAYFPATASEKSYLQSGASRPENGFPVTNKAVSVSFWIRPDPASQTNPCYVYRHGSWGGDGRQFVFWIVNEGKEIEVEIDNWLTVDSPNSPRFAVAGLMDGGWHHVAFGYDANTLKVWYDGELKSTKTGTHTLSISSGTEVVLGSSETDKRFVGAMDEVSVWDHQLTDEEVAAEYAFAHPRVEDPAALLPEPVCHWTFDDAHNPGKAAKGGTDLVPQEGVGEAPSLVANTGAFGGSALKSTVALKAAQADLPANFPKGDSPYTVSLRFSSNGLQENATLLAFGDRSAANTSFRFFNSGCPRKCLAAFGNKSKVSGWWSCCNQPTSFAHYVVTVDPQVGLLRFYRDGVQERIEYDFTGTLGEGDFFLNGDSAKTGAGGAFFDDVRIYDRALSPEEVRTLTASLGTGTRGPVLPATSPVTVAAGATLAVDAEQATLHSVSGAGTVAIGAGSAVLAHGWADFAGSVAGPGTLLLSKDGADVPATASVAADVVFEDGTVAVSAANAERPRVTTTGKVRLPKTGTLKLVDAKGSSSWNGKAFRIASCADWEGPATAAGWTFEPALVSPDWDAKCAFVHVDGTLLLKMPGAGTVILFR